MQLLKTFAFVLAAACLALAAAAPAQTADADQARSLLQRGQELFNAMEYAEAKSVLLEIKQDDLGGQEAVEQWDSLLRKSSQALIAQQRGQEDFVQAGQLLNENKFAEAIERYQAVLANEYVHADLKRDVRAMITLANAKASRQAEQKPAEPVEAEVVAEPAAVETPAEPVAVEPAAEAPVAEPVETPVVEAPAAEVVVAEVVEAPEPVVDKAAIREQAQRIRTQAMVQNYLRDGKLLLDANAPDRALASFRQALTLDPNNVEAEAGFQRAQVMLDAGVSPDSSLQNMLQRREIALQESRAKYETAMVDAANLLGTAASQADFVAASERARFAMSMVQANQQLYTSEEFTTKMAQANDLLDRVAEREASWGRQQALAARADAARRVAEYEAEMRRQRGEKIASLKERTRLLEGQRKWEQALEAVEEILRLDPANAWAGSRQELLRNYRTAFEQARANRVYDDEEQKHLMSFAWDTIPWYDLLRYPKDWAEITRIRTGGVDGAESAADRAVRLKLDEIQPEFRFDNTDFGTIIDFFRTVAEVNITVNWDELLNTSGVDRDRPVTLYLTNVSTDRALKEVLSSIGALDPLGYVVRDGVVRISTRNDLSSIVDTVVYDIKDILFTTPNFRGPVLSIEREEASDGGGEAVDLFDDADDEEEDAEDDRLQAITNLMDTIRSSIDPTSWDVNAAISELNGMIVVTQTPENHRRIANLLNQLRESESVQINIEARYITVSTGFLNDVGLTLNFFLNTGSTLTRNMDDVADPENRNPVVANPGSSSTTLPQWSGTRSFSDRFTPISGLQNSDGFTGFPTTGVPGGIGSAVADGGYSALSLAGTFLDDIQVDFLLRATQADQKTSSFLAPRLTLSNGQRAYVAMTQEQAYVSDLEAVTDENVVAYDMTISTLATGNTLDVEAVASADRRYVTMTLYPSLSSVVDLYNMPTTTVLPDGTTNTAYAQLPVTNQTRYRATVKIPDGGTLLVAGERRAGESFREMGVPILNKIPVVNRFFNNRSTVRDEYMTIMLIKPKIIISKEYETYELAQ